MLAVLVLGPSIQDPGAGHGGFHVGGHTTVNTGGEAPSSDTPAGSAPPTHTTLTACQGDGACPDFTCPPGQVRAYSETSSLASGTLVSSGPVCLGGNQVSVAAAVASAFRRIPVPTPALHIQPVKGRTLVNFKTNFYATGGTPFTRTVHLLGHTVTLRIHVASYDFTFGDGQHLTTTDAGAAYPTLTNHHEYATKGTVHPSLTTTWTADYTLDGGTWHTVDGTVTQHTAPQQLEVTTARPVLVDPSH